MELSERLSIPIQNTPFRCRPLAFILAVFLLALFLFWVDLVLFFVFLAICLAFSVWALFFSKREKRGKSAMAYAVLAVLTLAVLLPLPSKITCARLTELKDEHTVKAVITDAYYEERFGCMYAARLVSVDGKSYDAGITLTFDSPTALFVYDTVEVVGEMSSTVEGVSSSERLRALSSQTYVNCEVSELKSVTNEAKGGFEYFVYRIRMGIGGYFSSLLTPETAAYAKALIIGESSELAGSLKTDMSALGISHILAVSGMHMSIIATIVAFIIERISYSRRIKSVTVIVGSVLFMTVAGFSPSVTRACVMLVISMTSVFFHGKSDSITSLFTAGAIICAADPSSVVSCGFLLSFFATLGIVLCALYAQRRAAYSLRSSRAGDMRLPFRILRYLLFSLLMTVCAMLFTAPVMALYFSRISFFAVAMNLIAVPMAFVSVVLSILVLVFGMIPYVGAFICLTFDKLYHAFRVLVKYLGDVLNATVSIEYWFFPICCALLVSILVFIWVKKITSPIAVISAFVSFAVIFSSSVLIHNAAVRDRVELRYYAVKSSEGFLLTSGTETYYVDVGNGGKSMPSLGAKDALEVYCGTKLDGYVITHYHSRHIGTLQRLMRETGVRTVYLPIPYTESEERTYEYIAKSVKNEYGTKIELYSRGAAVKLGKAELTISPGGNLERSSHPVMTLMFSVNDRAVAYIGSSVSEAPGWYFAEEYIAKSSAIIVGNEGPVQKESHKYQCFDKRSVVYLSEFEMLNEKVAFPNGKYVEMKAVDGTVRAVFSLSD